jgi:hypothetical protein
MKSKLTIDKYGTKKWKLPNGLLHREDGPAIELCNDSKYWYLNGVPYTEQQYKIETRSIKLKLLL